jgi:hypothetical protein
MINEDANTTIISEVPVALQGALGVEVDFPIITVTLIGDGCTTCTSGSDTYTLVTNTARVMVPDASTGSVVAESTSST